MVIDAHSKWPEIFDMTTTSATQTIATLRQLFSAYGLRMASNIPDVHYTIHLQMVQWNVLSKPLNMP